VQPISLKKPGPWKRLRAWPDDGLSGILGVVKIRFRQHSVRLGLFLDCGIASYFSMRGLASFPFAATCLVCFCWLPLLAQEPTGGNQMTPNELVREVVKAELNEREQDHSHWMYRLDRVKGGIRETLHIVETEQGVLTRVIAKNGQSLTEQQQAEEEQNIDGFINNPEEQRKRQQDQNDDERKTKQLLKLLPNALSFEYAEHKGSTITLNFEPNPAFHPPSREAHAFQEMEGQLIVEERQKRLMEIRGRLKDAVHFGLLGHLDPGGTFHVRQQEVTPNHWEITLLNVNMKGKALFFKTINVQQDETRSRFRKIPDDLTLSQAKNLLQENPNP
jgi:hypothetical protein